MKKIIVGLFFSLILLNSTTTLASLRNFADFSKKPESAGILTILGILLFLILWFRYVDHGRKIDLEEYNKKHNKKFKTYEDLAQHQKKKKEKILLKEEKKRLQEEKHLEQESIKEKRKKEQEDKKTEKEASGSDLISRLKRLKKMYNDGNLNKAEFEKAKNKLLK